MKHSATFDTLSEALAFVEWLNWQRANFQHSIEEVGNGHEGLMYYRVTYFN